ncbi:helicase [Reticulibacter mediterranei]|uniref:Helicase n=1 Tax=Reticulibacter mediterranei TaxID=2778369 RepID=A0A8J3IUD7_9CHLR|nr:ABC transporter ATP-binding protein [Reticulibacter mediterranei]GHO98059.1 helicase [Reticulibacter mediterranei]
MSAQFRSHRRLLVTYLKPLWGRVILLAILLIVSIGLQLVNPQVIRAFIDATQAGSPLSTLLLAAGIFLALAVSQRIIAFLSVFVAESLGWRATNALREDLTLHCLRLDMPFHKTHTPGELIERIDADVTALANFFSQFTVNVTGNSLLILGILVLLGREDWRIGAGFALYCIAAFFLLRAIQQVAVKRWASQRTATADFYGFLEEHISGTEDIRAAGAEQYVINRLFLLMRRLLESTRFAKFVSNSTSFSINFLYATAYSAGLGVGAYLYSLHQVSIGTAYLLVFYIGMLANPLETIRKQMQDLQQASASIERVEVLLSLQPQIRDGNRAVPTRVSESGVTITFDRVSFSYDQQENVLEGINFQLQPGKVLGLLGRTGSGKTTLARLLFRLYDPGAGSIRLNDVDIREMALSDLREQVGMVTQDVQLFQASVRDNLTFFKQQVSDAHIEQVLKELDLWQWVEQLPEGLDTRLAAGGQSLSAGEAQLLAFARVFLKNPGLVVLDEASSRLDPATEHLLEQAVDRLLQQRTGIVIAHRLQTVQRADEIMILEDGRIVEYGARVALASDPNSRFYHLLQTGLEEVLA